MSSEAAQMRQEIEGMAASGQSEEVIIEHYKAQYGERILVVPDGRTGRVLFYLPLAAFVICSVGFFLILRRMLRAGAHPRPRAEQEELDCRRGEFRELIERELRELA
jgi:cytochrome c-type biogenesis protein CcmH/NrfF